MKKNFSDFIADTMGQTMESEDHLKMFRTASRLKKNAFDQNIDEVMLADDDILDADDVLDAKDKKKKDDEECGDMNYAKDKKKDEEKEEDKKVTASLVMNKLLSLSQDLERLNLVKSADLSLRLLDILITEAKAESMTPEEKKREKEKAMKAKLKAKQDKQDADDAAKAKKAKEKAAKEKELAAKKKK